LPNITHDVEQTVITLVRQIFAVDKDLAAGGGVQLQQQVQQRGLAAPAGAHDGVELVFLQRQVQSLEDLGFVRLVLEFNVFELNVSEFFQRRFDFGRLLELLVFCQSVNFLDCFARVVVPCEFAE